MSAVLEEFIYYEPFRPMADGKYKMADFTARFKPCGHVEKDIVHIDIPKAAEYVTRDYVLAVVAEQLRRADCPVCKKRSEELGRAARRMS